MAFDAGMLYAVLHEIEDVALGARVEKVHQPSREEIVFLLRGKRLSVNIGSTAPRVSITHITKDNPLTAPMFCMLLRKHLSGATLIKIEQCGFDRVACFSFSGYDEMGFPTEKRVYTELMGKYSNLVLTDGTDKIIAVAKPIDFSDSDIRQLLPNMTYTLPPKPDKADPLSCVREEFLAFLQNASPDASLARFITDTFAGTATVVAREIVFRAFGKTDVLVREAEPQLLWDAFFSWFSSLRTYAVAPSISFDENGAPVAFSYLPLTHRSGSVQKAESISKLFDTYFGEKDRAERIRSRAADLVRLVTHSEARLRKKLALQREELASSEKGEEFRRAADLITAEIYKIKRGVTSFDATDYSVDPPIAVKVELDARLSPAQNAQRYYKLYSKAKKARSVLREQLEITEKELHYMESVSAFLKLAETEADLADLRDELARAGYASRLKRHTPQKQIKARPLEFKTSGGYRVLCGRNNLQNELLTFKIAEKGDLWFHAKDVPGSHVILVCGGDEPPEADYTEAAEIAALYSAATADLVAVDYTRIKNVKKPPASKPGYVTYKTNYTAFVRPRRRENT